TTYLSVPSRLSLSSRVMLVSSSTTRIFFFISALSDAEDNRINAADALLGAAVHRSTIKLDNFLQDRQPQAARFHRGPGVSACIGYRRGVILPESAFQFGHDHIFTHLQLRGTGRTRRSWASPRPSGCRDRELATI